MLFQLSTFRRKEILERHNFYVEQVTSRVLVQLSDAAIEAEADETTESAWMKIGQQPSDGTTQWEDFAEDALDEGIAKFELLWDLRNDLLLSSVSAIYHAWDKQLRQWLVDEIARWYRGTSLIDAVWNSKIADILNLLKALNFDVRGLNCYEKLNICRLVVNVYKHGDGISLAELKTTYPECLSRRISLRSDFTEFSFMFDQKDHSHLEIIEAEFEQFAAAISSFWEDVPEGYLDGEKAKLPRWFRQALAA